MPSHSPSHRAETAPPPRWTDILAEAFGDFLRPARRIQAFLDRIDPKP